MNSIPSSVAAVTLGDGLNSPQARRVYLNASKPVTRLIVEIEEADGETESWWSPHIFKGDYRRKENWEGSIAFAGDLDYYAEGKGHSAPPDEVRARFAALPLDVNASHSTPRGERVVSTSNVVITDAQLYHDAALGFAQRLTSVHASQGWPTLCQTGGSGAARHRARNGRLRCSGVLFAGSGFGFLTLFWPPVDNLGT